MFNYVVRISHYLLNEIDRFGLVPYMYLKHNNFCCAIRPGHISCVFGNFQGTYKQFRRMKAYRAIDLIV